MRRLLSTPIKGQLKITWHLDGDRLFDLLFSRIVAGIAWGATNYAVVVGERLIEGREQANRYWIVLDEAQTTTPQELFTALIPLKDDYRLGVLVSPNNPAPLAEALRQLEGLTHYRTSNYGLAEQRWPTFVDFDQTAALYQVPPPDDKLIHQEIDRWLNETVPHPDTEAPILDSAGDPVNRLMLPHDFPNTYARTAVQQAKPDGCLALWLACAYLEKRRPVKLTGKPEGWEHRPGKGGY